jgi:Tfp pilus assembly pilus retraction ATPase PilT
MILNLPSIHDDLRDAPSIEDYVEILLRGLEREHGFLPGAVTDILIDHGRPPAFVASGDLRFTDCPKVQERIIDSMVQHLKPSARDAFMNDMDADGRFKLPGGGITRMHLFRSGDSLGDAASAALRLQPPKPFTWEQMKLPDEILELLDKPQGLILFSGPVGSRKTSACHAMLDYVNKRVDQPRHIYTIEDPPEFEHEDIGSLFHSREIGHTAKDFPMAIHGALRVRPNIILIGELRTPETIDAGLLAARLGRLALATIHSETTIKTISRITQAFPEGKRGDVLASLKDNLIGVINLRTVPTVQGGEVLAYEVLLIDQNTVELIDKPLELLGALERPHSKMNSMEQCLTEFAKKGIISLDTANQYAPDATRLKI